MHLSGRDEDGYKILQMRGVAVGSLNTTRGLGIGGSATEKNKL